MTAQVVNGHQSRVVAEVAMRTTSPPRFVRLSRLVVASFAAVIAVSGCMVPLHTRGQRNPEPAEVLARKLVVGKEPPLDLIAEDGSRCLTTKDRFEKTRIGSKVWCLWSGDPERGLPPSQGR